jgi:hypothetical protein
MPLLDLVTYSPTAQVARKQIVIIFDVNEMLLELSSMQAAFQEAFDHPFCF